MKNKSLIITLAGFALLLIVAISVYPMLAEKATGEQEASTTEAPVEFGAPDITVFDTEGNAVRLSDFKGKPIIVNFWATWCGYCLMEMPDFENAYKKYGDDIHFLIINTDDGIKNGEAFIKGQGFTFPTYYDLEHDAYITYGLASGIPRTLAIDKDGNMVYNRSGMINGEILEGIIASVK